MEFRIADTFTASLARLPAAEQKAAKTTAFDLQMNPAGNGLQWHRLDRCRDARFWSVRVNLDIRIIVHKSAASLLLCYVDHHDKAYQWAERRKLETHPATGAAQLVEIRELVREIVTPESSTSASTAPTQAAPAALLTACSDDTLLAYGVPHEWLADVRAADEDSLLDLATHLPAEAAEALLTLAAGGTPAPAPPGTSTDPFAHPDAQRRFRIMSDTEELARALDYPWEKWTVFLHPAQRQMVQRDGNGPIRVAGSAGTGKTVVALHRAVYLAQQNETARILLTTLSDPLTKLLEQHLHRLVYNTPRLAEQIEVAALDRVAQRLYTPQWGKPEIATADEITAWLQTAATQVPELNRPLAFLQSEWRDIVDTWQTDRWEDYRDAKRLGRKTRLSQAQRALCWQVFAQVKTQMQQAGKVTRAGMFARLAQAMPARAHPPFDHIVVDEAQDIGVQPLRFLAAIAGNTPNGLFFAGDLGQRIFQQPFSWKTLGVDIRGRSHTLRINYRTSHQIRAQADRLLDTELADVDGNVESRKGTISVFNGVAPVIGCFDSAEQESRAVGQWLAQCCADGRLAHEIAVFVRSEAQFARALAAVEHARLPARVLDQGLTPEEGAVNITTMHLAKGMEFRAVAVMACDDTLIPLQTRIDTAADEAELTEITHTERHLLYVACTRARDLLHVSAVRPESEFLLDLQ